MWVKGAEESSDGGVGGAQRIPGRQIQAVQTELVTLSTFHGILENQLLEHLV